MNARTQKWPKIDPKIQNFALYCIFIHNFQKSVYARAYTAYTATRPLPATNTFSNNIGSFFNRKSWCAVSDRLRTCLKISIFKVKLISSMQQLSIIVGWNQPSQIARRLNFGMQPCLGPNFENIWKKKFLRNRLCVERFFAKRAYYRSTEWVENWYMALIWDDKYIFT